MFRLVVEAEIHPTEDPERVRQAVRNILPQLAPDVQTVGTTSVLKAESNDVSTLIRLHTLLRRERILDAARRSLFTGVSENNLEFGLNKQAACSGRVSFCEPEAPSPLGPIRFVVLCSDPSRLVEWLAPKTVHGKPVSEQSMPSFI